MSSTLTATKKAALLTRVKLSPEIPSDQDAWLNDCLDGAAEFIKLYCRLPRYPELSAGYAQGAATPSTDLSALTTNSIYIAVNGGAWLEVLPTLANCTTGAATAAELQSTIRAIDEVGLDEVTVTYNSTSGEDTYYTVTSGRYGEASAINFMFSDDDYKHVAQALKLTTDYGAVEVSGSAADDQLDSALVYLVQARFQQTGLEHAEGARLMGGVSFTAHDLPPMVKALLNSKRRLWS